MPLPWPVESSGLPLLSRSAIPCTSIRGATLRLMTTVSREFAPISPAEASLAVHAAARPAAAQIITVLAIIAAPSLVRAKEL
jgi:hypothetical protein